MATGPGPVGFRHGSDSLSTIQGGADQLLADGEVRPFSPGYGPAANPGESLWVDPNAAPAGTSPFGLDDACVDEDYQDPNMAAPSGAFMLDDEWWKKVGLDGPITMEQVQGLTAALAAKVSLTAFNALVADFEQHLLDANEGGVTIEQVNAAIAAAVGTVVADVATLSSQVSGLATDVGGLDTTVTGLSGDVNGLITAVAGKQAHSAELDILAALTSTPVGRQMLTAASFDAMKALLSLDAVANTAPADLPVSTATSTAILAAIATAAGDATTKANAAQAAAEAAAAADASTKAAAAVAFATLRSNHTGTQSADTLTDGTTNKAFLATERIKLAGVATAATANATDAQLRDRSTHTGTQLLSTISDAGNAASRNVGTTSTTVAAGDAPAAAQSAAIAAASGDATTKANNAQAAAVAAAGVVTAAAVAPHIINAPYAATLNVAAPAGGVTFRIRCTLTGDITLNRPTGLVDGQLFMYELTQGGAGDYIVDMGFSGGFRLGTDIPDVSLSSGVDVMDRIGCVYDATSGFADVISLAKGYYL